MQSSYFWTKGITRILIEEYRARPCLWKTKSRDYLNRNLRGRSYNELLYILKSADPGLTDLTLIDLKKKIDGLRTTFRREYIKVMTSRQHGLPDDYVYKPTLWYYDMMMFLIDGEATSEPSLLNEPYSADAKMTEAKMKPNASDYHSVTVKLEEFEDAELSEICNTSQSSHLDLKDSNLQYPYQNPDCHYEASRSMQHEPTPYGNYSAQVSEECSTSKAPTKRKSSMDDLYLLAEKQLRMLDDSEGIFGQNVASNLRKISNPTQRLVCEKLINDALYQARLSVLTVNSCIISREDGKSQQENKTGCSLKNQEIHRNISFDM